MRIGGHFSHASGLVGPFAVAKQYDANCFQMFIGPNQGYTPFDVGAPQAELFRKMKADGDYLVSAHGPYLPNVCCPAEPDRVGWSIRSIVDYMRAAEKLSIDFMVFHPGSHKTSSQPDGYESFLEATAEILRQTDGLKVKLLWENTAGGGTQIGHVEAVDSVVRTINERHRLGMCLDTVHSFADGHAIDNDQYRATFWEKYRAQTDWVHFNNPDRKVQLGSHLDRHREGWLEAKWPVDVMLAVATEWGTDAPLCMEADPTAYEVNFMLAEEAGILPR